MLSLSGAKVPGAKVPGLRKFQRTRHIMLSRAKNGGCDRKRATAVGRRYGGAMSRSAASKLCRSQQPYGPIMQSLSIDRAVESPMLSRMRRTLVRSH